MKRIIPAVLSFLCLALFLTGCQKSRTLYQYDMEEYVRLGDYKGLHVDSESDEFKEMLESYIQTALTNAELTSTETLENGAVLQNGDALKIDFVGKMDGEEFEGGSANDYSLTLGSGQFIDGFEEGLVGKKVGDTVDLNLNFPDPYQNNPELAGKPVVFTVTVNSATRTIYPELNEEVAKQLSYDSLEEFETAARDAVVAETLWNQIEETSQVLQYPDAEMEYYVQDMMDYYKSYAENYNMTFNDFLTSNQFTSEDDFRTFLTEQIKPTVANEMLYYAIADAEGISLSKEDLETGTENMASERGMTVAEYKENMGEEYIESVLMFNKVKDFLLENAVVD